MSSARPVSSRCPFDHREVTAQSDLVPRTSEITKTARILPWIEINAPASPSGSAGHPLWLWPNLLSLDAPLIAVLWLHLFAISARVHISPFATLALALVVWIIYVADRLLDGLRYGPRTVPSPRHQFYRDHRKAWFSVLPGALAVTCCVCLALDARTLELGALVMLVVAGYFAIVHWVCLRFRLRFPKEAVVALVFGVGTFFPAWIYERRSTVAMAIALVSLSRSAGSTRP